MLMVAHQTSAAPQIVVQKINQKKKYVGALAYWEQILYNQTAVTHFGVQATTFTQRVLMTVFKKMFIMVTSCVDMLRLYRAPNECHYPIFSIGN